jgi:4-hydroxy-tetrahydrodipicolinate synthase
MGGYGVISVASHLVGLQMKEMMEKCLEGDKSGADEIFMHLLPLIKALFVVSNPVPVKYALNLVGFKVGRPRLPLVEPDARSAALIKETLADYRIDLPLK